MYIEHNGPARLCYKNRTDEAAAALNAEQAVLNQELAELNQWAADLNQRIAQINQDNLAHYAAFTEKARAALNAGFTGTKTVRLSAKSWINSATLPLLASIKGIMLRMDPNTAPAGPGLSDAATSSSTKPSPRRRSL